MTRNSVQDRRFDVLYVIVTQYVATHEPVGSKAIAAGGLGASSTIIRNDIAALEEAGLICQSHTSMEYVPTDRGYRMFADRLAGLKLMSGPERHALETSLAELIDIDDVVEHSARLLAQAMHQAALVQHPETRVRVLRHLEVIAPVPGHALVVVIVANGEVRGRSLTLHVPFGDRQLHKVHGHLHHHCDGTTSVTAQVCVDEVVAPVRSELVGTVAVVDSALTDALSGQGGSKIIIAGAANLAREAFDSHDIAPAPDALEEQVVLMRPSAEADPGADVHASTGAENPYDDLAEVTVTTGTYRTGVGDSTGSVHLGTANPMHMDYARTMSSMRVVATYLSCYLAPQHGD